MYRLTGVGFFVCLLAVVLLLAYPLTYAPAFRLAQALQPEAYPGGPNWSFYEPVHRAMTKSVAVRKSLFWWAKAWGVGNEFASAHRERAALEALLQIHFSGEQMSPRAMIRKAFAVANESQ